MKAMNAFTPATLTEGGDTVVSFGSGDNAGRLQTRARGSVRNQSASPRAVSALRSRINRANITRAERRNLLSQIDANASRRGNVRTGTLASIDADLRDLLY